MVTTEKHTFAIDSAHDSVITHVNLYQDMARVARSYTVNVDAGQTELSMSSLPNVMDYDSLRVEGRGAAVIQGVTAFKQGLQAPDETSPLLDELKVKKAKVGHAIERCKKAIGAVDAYMGNISVEHLDISKLGEAMDIYDTTEEKWDSKVLELEEELRAIEGQIEAEKKRLKESGGNRQLRTVVASAAVSQAHWEAGYDLRVDLEDKERTVKLVYKAAISQQTGEDWKDVPIFLETALPTFGLDPPTLGIWALSHTKATRLRQTQFVRQPLGGKAARKQMADPGEDFIQPLTATVSSEGYVNATFQLPGLTSVPSDDEEHKVVIAELELPVKMAWTCVPKLDTRVFLEATIINTSDFTLLEGESNIYVDGCFISRVDLSLVSPGETFKAHLGVDPTIRVTYHPRTDKVAETGFYHKSIKYSYSQRVSVHNTKPIAIEGLRITDNIPVSQDANITVTLLQPLLPVPVPAAASASASASTASSKNAAMRERVRVAEGVKAQWVGADDKDVDAGSLGKDGHFEWVCDVPAMGKMGLVLEYEVVSTDKDAVIYGLGS
ncbi:hypothetical protein CVT26_007228 [Gymnopilus dilepis]|uniref:DUF4139 domain-containing protein n=1 Tax=Gymnopilus dilepis TaxID=231916 RepID=A0A409VMD2_9AGAR|nr:hypothetical protein CVT26_007228 [Gymnopilus dilepis]